MLEHIPNAFYALDRDFRFIHVNKRIVELLGRTETELLNNSIWQLFPEWKQLPYYEVLQQAMSGNTTGHLERFSQIHHRWFELYAYPSDYGLAIYIHDVTERKQAEMRLRMLNECGKILAYEHDLSHALQRITRVIVPEFSDWITINELVGDEIKTLAFGSADYDSLQWASDYLQGVKLEVAKPRPGSLAWVVKIGQPVMVNQVTEDYLRSIASNEEQFQVLKRARIEARIVVPISMRGKTIGAITFLSSVPGKNYQEADLGFATDLSILIGLSIENMRMFNEMKKEFAQKIRSQSVDAYSDRKTT